MRRSREAAEPGSSSQGDGKVQRDVGTVVIFLLPPGCIQHGHHRGIMCPGLRNSFLRKQSPQCMSPEEKGEECLTGTKS